MARRKQVKLNLEDFLEPLHVYKYDSLVNELRNESQRLGVELTSKQLAHISYQVQSYLEFNFGKDSSKPRSITKIPSSLFNDFSLGGAMNIILSECLQFQIATQKGNFNITDSPVDEVTPLLKRVENRLIEVSLLKRPCVYLKSVHDSDMHQLESIVTSHGGTLALSEEAASHVIEYNSEVDTLPEETDEFVRPVELLGPTQVRVHWFYFPDSYDDIIPREEVDIDNPDTLSQMLGLRNHAPADVPKKWRLCCRFIKDCELFNEWGNEHDYEFEEKQDDLAEQEVGELSSRKNNVKRKSRGRKSATAQSPVPSAPQAAEEKEGPSEHLFETIGPSTLYRPSAQVTVLADDEAKSSVVTNPNHSASSQGSPATKKRKLQPASSSKGPAPQVLYKNSLSAAELESPLLASPTGHEQYLRVRNQIVDLYKQNPAVFLSATDCRKKVAGDVNFIFQVHALLNANGLINSEVPDGETRPQLYQPVYPAHPGSANPSGRQLTVLKSYVQAASSPSDLSPLLVGDCKAVIDELGAETSRDLIIEILKMSNVSGVAQSFPSCLNHFSHPVMLQIDPNHALERLLTPLGLDRVALVAALTDRKAESTHNLSKLVHEYLALRLKALDERVTG